MKRTLKQWKQIDVISQIGLILLMFLFSGFFFQVNSRDMPFFSKDVFRFGFLVLFILFALNQMISFFLHRKFAKQYNSSLGRNFYFVLLIIHHIVAASLLLVSIEDKLWMSVYYLFFSAIVLSILYVAISVFELITYKSESSENAN